MKKRGRKKGQPYIKTEYVKKRKVQEIIERRKVLREKKRQACLKNFFLFNKYVMQWPDLSEPLHHEMCDFIQFSKKNKKLMLVARGHLKSSVITVSYALWRIAQNPEIRIFIANATYNMAVSFLSQIKSVIQKNEIYRDLFGEFDVGAEKWSNDMIKVGTTSFKAKESTVTAYGMGGNLVGQHYDLIIMDDVVARENIGTKEQRDKTLLFYKDALDLLDPGGEVIIIGCFIAGTKILMADGTWKNIENVNAGEMVKTRKGDKIVTTNILQGVSDVYELRTNNGKIVGTKNHPFLKKGKWVKMEDLKKGNKISFYSGKKDGRKDISKEMAWALGYMVGDGWVTLHPNSKGSMRYVVGIARGIYKDRNEKIKNIFEKNFGCKFQIKRKNWHTTCAELGRWLLENGLERGAKNKKVPDFIFEQDLERRVSFIKGFLDADGWEDKGKYNVKSFCYEVTSKELAEGIRLLAIISGLRVNNIYSRKRLIKAPNSKEELISNTYHCRLYFGEPTKEVFVRSIKKVGKQEVYDLSVEGEHSFIAEGFIVHNTTWHQYDLYNWIMDEDSKVISDFDIFVKPAYQGNWGDGIISFPEKFSWKHLEELKRQKGPSEFAAQYLLNPVPEESAIFKRHYFKEYEDWEIRGKHLNRFMAVDPAISEEKSADYSAIVVVGVDEFDNWYILDIFAERCGVERLIGEIFHYANKHRPIEIALEMEAYAKSLQYFMSEEMKRRGQFLPITEVRSTRVGNDKEYRIKALEPRYFNGFIYHNKHDPKTRDLEEQLTSFPKQRNDDIMDALAYINQIAFSPRKARDRANRRQKYLYNKT